MWLAICDQFLWTKESEPWTGKSCFVNRALVMAIFEAPKCLSQCFLRPRNWSRLKPHYLSIVTGLNLGRIANVRVNLQVEWTLIIRAPPFSDVFVCLFSCSVVARMIFRIDITVKVNMRLSVVFPHLLVVNQFLRSWLSQTESNWLKLIEIDWNRLKLIEISWNWLKSNDRLPKWGLGDKFLCWL